MGNPFDRLLDQFVADVTRAAQSVAMDALRVALGTPHTTPRAVHRVGGGRLPVAHKAKQPRRARVIDKSALEGRIVAALRANPDQTVAELGTALGQTTAALQGPIKTLIATKRARFRGQTRGRRYSLMASANSKARRATKKVRRAKRRRTKR